MISPGDTSHWSPVALCWGREPPGLDQERDWKPRGLAWFIQQEGDAWVWPELIPQALGLFFIDPVSDVEGKKLLLMDEDQSFPLPRPVQGLRHGCLFHAALA